MNIFEVLPFWPLEEYRVTCQIIVLSLNTRGNIIAMQLKAAFEVDTGPTGQQLNTLHY